MFIGSPMTKPETFSFAAKASSTSASIVNFCRLMTGRGVAKRRPRSDIARPIVFVPRSSPAIACPDRNTAASSSIVSTVIVVHPVKRN
ncbi:hypothetical protein AJ87_25420 [Rhizobium yanglingense]|nr:hypothetical protein AJ87_25420 [Rhizobium yanglingense]